MHVCVCVCVWVCVCVRVCVCVYIRSNIVGKEYLQLFTVKLGFDKCNNISNISCNCSQKMSMSQKKH